MLRTPISASRIWLTPQRPSRRFLRGGYDYCSGLCNGELPSFEHNVCNSFTLEVASIGDEFHGHRSG